MDGRSNGLKRLGGFSRSKTSRHFLPRAGHSRIVRSRDTDDSHGPRRPAAHPPTDGGERPQLGTAPGRACRNPCRRGGRRVAAVGDHVVAGDGDLRRLQVADVGADATRRRAGVASGGVPAGVAGPGRRGRSSTRGGGRRGRPRAEWVGGGGKLAGGVALLYGWARYRPPADPYWLGWVGMVGLILCLHFGAFAVLSCGWRAAGVEARPLMNRPLASVRLSRVLGWAVEHGLPGPDAPVPVPAPHAATRRAGGVVGGVRVQRVGPRRGDLRCRPAAGTAGPTVVLPDPSGRPVVRAEPGRPPAGPGRRPPRPWLFTMACLLGPARLLFHKPFVVGVIVPFLRVIGAAP